MKSRPIKWRKPLCCAAIALPVCLGAIAALAALVVFGGVPDGRVTIDEFGEDDVVRIAPAFGHWGSGLALRITGEVSGPTTLVIGGDREVELPVGSPFVINTYQDWFTESCEIECRSDVGVSGEIKIRYDFRL